MISVRRYNDYSSIQKIVELDCFYFMSNQVGQSGHLSQQVNRGLSGNITPLDIGGTGGSTYLPLPVLHHTGCSTKR